MTNVTREKISTVKYTYETYVQDVLNFTFNLGINIEVLADWFEQHLSVSLVIKKLRI